MEKNEEDILLEVKDKVAMLKTIIDAWHDASHNEEKGTTKSYCIGRAHGLEVCLPTIENLVASHNEALATIRDLLDNKDV